MDAIDTTVQCPKCDAILNTILTTNSCIFGAIRYAIFAAFRYAIFKAFRDTKFAAKFYAKCTTIYITKFGAIKCT